MVYGLTLVTVESVAISGVWFNTSYGGESGDIRCMV